MFPYWTVTEKWTRIHEFQESVQALLSSSVRGFRRVCLSNSSRDFSVVVLSIFYFSCCCCDSVFIQTSVDYIIFMCAKSEVDAAAVHRTNQPSSLSTGWTLLVAAELWNFPPTSEMKALLFGRMRIGATFRRLVESLETMSGEKNVMLKKTKKKQTRDPETQASRSLTDLTLRPPSACCLQRPVDAKSSTLLPGNRPPSPLIWIGWNSVRFLLRCCRTFEMPSM